MACRLLRCRGPGHVEAAARCSPPPSSRRPAQPVPSSPLLPAPSPQRPRGRGAALLREQPGLCLPAAQGRGLLPAGGDHPAGPAGLRGALPAGEEGADRGGQGPHQGGPPGEGRGRGGAGNPFSSGLRACVHAELERRRLLSLPRAPANATTPSPQLITAPPKTMLTPVEEMEAAFWRETQVCVRGAGDATMQRDLSNKRRPTEGALPASHTARPFSSHCRSLAATCSTAWRSGRLRRRRRAPARCTGTSTRAAPAASPASSWAAS